MKSKLSMLLAAFIIAPLALACPSDKTTGRDQTKKDAATVADCGKCKKGDKDKDKDGTLAECDKCKKGDKDKDKDKDGTLA